MWENIKLSKNFTLEQLTHTEHRDLLEENQIRSATQIANLKRLAIDLLEPINTKYPNLYINSGYRCLALNTAIGSLSTSQHVFGMAADFTCPGIYDMAGKRKVLDWIWKESGLRWHQLLIESNGCLHIATTTGTRDMQVGIFDNPTRKMVYLQEAQN